MPDFQVAALLRCRSGQVVVTGVVSLLAGVAVAGGVRSGSIGQQLDASDYPVRYDLERPRQASAEWHVIGSSENMHAGSDIAATEATILINEQVLRPQRLSGTSSFEEAFKDIDRPSSQSSGEGLTSKALKESSASSTGFIRDSFRLENFRPAANSMRQEKRFVLNEVVLGNLSLEFSSSSTINLRPAELLRVLDGKVPNDIYKRVEQLSAGGEMVSFDELRTTGFEIRYDAVNDRIVVKI